MRKLWLRSLKPELLIGIIVLLSGVLTESTLAQTLATAIDASRNANQLAAQNYASHNMVLNNCSNFVASAARSYEHLPPVKVPAFGYNASLNPSIPFNCKQSGPYSDPNDPSTSNKYGPDLNKGWYLQEIDGIAIKDTVADVGNVCRKPVPSPPQDAFLTRICNPRAIVANGGASMSAPCIGSTSTPIMMAPNMTGPGGCAVCVKLKDPAGSLCHERKLTTPGPHP